MISTKFASWAGLRTLYIKEARQLLRKDSAFWARKFILSFDRPLPKPSQFLVLIDIGSESIECRFGTLSRVNMLRLSL